MFAANIQVMLRAIMLHHCFQSCQQRQYEAQNINQISNNAVEFIEGNLQLVQLSES